MSAVLQHTSAFDPYLRHGWKLVPIQAGTKGPRSPGWNVESNCITSSSAIPQGFGAGLAHAYSGTCAIDLDDVFGSSVLFAERGLDIHELMGVRDAVQINSGRPGSGKLIYKLTKPLPSKKISIGGKVILEFRCATANGSTVQDLLPPSAHPSGSTYQWAGAGNWRNLPELPAEILDWWEDLIEADGVHSIAIPGEVDASWDEIRDALGYIPPSCAYDPWITCGMAIHFAGSVTDQDAEAFVVWNEWSMNSEKYRDQRDLEYHWKSFKTTHPTGIKLGSLFHIAREYGWKRPAPDVVQLFASVEPISPTSIISGMVVRPPSLDFDLLPPVLAKRAMEVGDSVGCDPLVSAVAGLGAICAAADARSRLVICEGFEVPPVLWLATIGSPSAKKTPGAVPMLAPLTKIEKDDIARYVMAMQDWELKEAQSAAQQKARLKQAEEATREQGEMSDVLKPYALPPRPVQKKLTIMDATSQKLLRLAAERPEGMLVVLDEMATWLNKMASPMSGEDRSSIIQGYSAAPYSMERVGAGSIPIENLALSVYGNIQPKIWRQFLKALSADGFIQRFIPVALDDEKSKVGKPLPAWASSAGDYEHMIRRAHAAPPTKYYLDQVGAALFHDFMHWADDLRTMNRMIDESDIYLTALGKIEGTAGRLILACHMATAPESVTVSNQTVVQTLELIKTFIVPSLRHVYGDIGGLGDDGMDRWMIDHIVSIADQPSVTLSDLRRSAKRQIDGIPILTANEMIRTAASLLETMGWLAVTEDKGRSTVWAINPTIAATFADHRAKVKALHHDLKLKILASAKAQGKTIKSEL